MNSQLFVCFKITSSRELLNRVNLSEGGVDSKEGCGLCDILLCLSRESYSASQNLSLSINI